MMIGAVPVPLQSQVVSAGGGGGTYGNWVELLLNGANGSTTFVDTSPFNRPVVPTGGAQISTAQSVSGGSSLLLDGVDDHLLMVWNTPLTGNFTLSVDVRLTGYTDATAEVFSINNTATVADLILEIEQSLGNRVRLSVRNAGTTTYCDFYSTNGITLNTWVNIRAEILNGTATLYLDGVANGSASVPTTRVQNLTAARVGILNNVGATRFFMGYIDNFLISV